MISLTLKSDEQSELTSKLDRLIDREQPDSSGGGQGMEGLSKTEKGLMNMDNRSE